MEHALSLLSVAAQDYLKAIWTIDEVSGSKATVKHLAERLGVRPSTASDAVRRLEQAGYVAHAPYGSVDLTPAGRSLALAMVRRHRMLETFLVDHLGYSWDEVHEEADRLEHAVSDQLVDRLERMLGHPGFDPHGDPIPTKGGRMPSGPSMSLNEAQVGVALRLVRVLDGDPDLLRYLADHGITVGASLVLIEKADTVGVVSIAVEGGSLTIGVPEATALRVVPA